MNNQPHPMTIYPFQPYLSIFYVLYGRVFNGVIKQQDKRHY